MGQASSSSVVADGLDQRKETEDEFERGLDYTQALPDEILALIFSKVKGVERNGCSLVCKRWYFVEGESRHRLSLNCKAEIDLVVPDLFRRFQYVSNLALRCDKKTLGIDDQGLLMIGVHCKGLKSLKLVSCSDITDAGIANFAQVCTSLKKFSCRSCKLGFMGLKAIVTYCTYLEEINVKRVKSILPQGNFMDTIVARCDNMKRICLREVCEAHLFLPIIAGSRNLRTLKIYRCSGLGDMEMAFIAANVRNLVELHLQKMNVGDMTLRAVASLANLEVFHLAKTVGCTNAGLAAVANGCRKLQRLHVNGWRRNRIGDDGLIMIGKNCPNLKELVLIGLNVTVHSLSMVASNCPVLERLALCSSETIGDAELCCIAEKCHSLKKLCIKGCPVSDQGMESLANGCPQLIKVKVKKCRGVTCEIVGRLMAINDCLIVNLDAGVSPLPDADVQLQGNHAMPSTSNSISAAGKLALSKLTLLVGGSFVACAFLKLSNGP